MKEFLFIAICDPQRSQFVYGREFAHTLPEAWRLFKAHRSTLYSELHFQSCNYGGKYYDKID